MSLAPLCRSRTTISVDRPDILHSLINLDRPVSCNAVRRRPHDSSTLVGNRNSNNNASFASSQHSSVVSGLVPDDELVNSTSFHNWLCPESIHKVQTTADPDCRQTTLMCESILNAEQQYSEDVSEFLCDQDMLDLRRRELLHRKWTDRVFNPIREQVDGEIENRFTDLRSHKQQLYNDFLEHCNRRGHVFLDTFGETRGSTSKLKPLQITAKTGPLDDPLLLQPRMHNSEDGIAVRCSTGKRLSTAEIERLRLPTVRLNPPGRHQMAWHDWQIMYINQIESVARQRERKKMNPNKTRSKVSWDNYFTPAEREVADEEYCVQKGEPYHRPRQPSPPHPQQEFTAAAL